MNLPMTADPGDSEPGTPKRGPLWSALDAYIGASGSIDPDKVARRFGMSKTQLAATIGLSPVTLQKSSRARAIRAQGRLREMLEILARIREWAGGDYQAMAWYRGQPLAALGGRTSESLVKDGQASIVRDYLDHIAQGGFA